MGKTKRQKNYDVYIPSNQRYLYKTRKMLLLGSVATYILNAMIVAVSDASVRKNMLISILFSIVFAVIQLIDNRKAQWGWLYIIVLSAVFQIFAALCVFTTQLHFMRYIWAGEMAVLLIFACLLLYKKNRCR